MNSKIQYEKETIERMLVLYCKLKHHSSNGLCSQCAELKEYAHIRLNKCKYGEKKPACKNCPVHCYKPDRRDAMKQVMRFTGPRMLFYHPKDFFIHLISSLKQRD
jgi:hypothetical protein